MKKFEVVVGVMLVVVVGEEIVGVVWRCSLWWLLRESWQLLLEVAMVVVVG